MSIYATPGAYVALAVVIQLSNTERSQQQQEEAEENSGPKPTEKHWEFLLDADLQPRVTAGQQTAHQNERQVTSAGAGNWGGRGGGWDK